MQQVPDTPTLLRAVTEWLDAIGSRSLTGSERYEARVAVNVLRIVERELLAGPGWHDDDRAAFAALLGDRDRDTPDPAHALAVAIADGRLGRRTPGLLDALHAYTVRRIALDNPAHLLPDDRS